ncbi:MAG TPA: hypothetical protein VFF04_01740 [Candidatus Babeliales bacterium]|nr:hypothetical protein [Candidatus Babeliales bacterium]
MAKRLFNVVFFILMLCTAGLTQTMSFDNRFIPLIQHPYVTVIDRPSHGAFNFFMLTGHQAFGEFDEEIGIPELFGKYDQRDIAKAIVARGCPNPLRSAFRNLELPWIVQEKLQGQGVDFYFQQQVTNNFSLGFTWFIMSLNSYQHFNLKKNDSMALTKSEEQELDEVRRSMQEMLCLFGPRSHQVGWGDLDFYLHFGESWDYTLKFRHIDAGLRLGVLIPAGLRRKLDNPSSIPFGGDGFWGIYGDADAELELKEDWKLGLLFRINKRISRTCLQRMPIGNEPSLFGGVVGPARVDPGFTFIMSPYLSFENLREGFGARVQYSISVHTEDHWTDKRSDATVPVSLDKVVKFSEWASDYMTLCVFYDFGKMKVIREFNPIVNFNWDIPVSFVAAHASAKTTKISLGLEFNW